MVRIVYHQKETDGTKYLRKIIIPADTIKPAAAPLTQEAAMALMPEEMVDCAAA